ncbi:hypothetical protein GCM10012280_48960 [Wenjunlia tyrosinilytica]|uniref:Uncharacterized protein n=1 Tax=Wenjunlia tyrosinilytica TaxID=1544741 RepID=A0A917ZTJ8_9ACTN|nr:hypothetical protein GCM10012280_48960 [Wenjunlia tyrosinilytica]
MPKRMVPREVVQGIKAPESAGQAQGTPPGPVSGTPQRDAWWTAACTEVVVDHEPEGVALDPQHTSWDTTSKHWNPRRVRGPPRASPVTPANR